MPCAGCFSDMSESNLSELGQGVRTFLDDELDTAVRNMGSGLEDNAIVKGQDCSVKIKAIDRFQKQVESSFMHSSGALLHQISTWI